MLAHRRDDFVVQVFNEVAGFLLQAFSGFADTFAYAPGCFFNFAIEVAHKLQSSRAEKWRIPNTSLFRASQGRSITNWTRRKPFALQSVQPWIPAPSIIAGCRNCVEHSCAGTTKIAASYRGEVPALHTVFGFQKSCCSRRGSRRSCRDTRNSSAAFIP